MESSENQSKDVSTFKSTNTVWWIIIVMVSIGILALIFMSIQFSDAKDKVRVPSLLETLQVIGAALLVAGASFASGGVGGFLFGIPKVLQRETQDQNSTNKISIVQNDNLVEISDWLTKIIVGVGLTQLYKIPTFLGRVGRNFSPVFGGDDTPSSKAAVVCVTLYFLSLGFFAVYLWTRLFFVRILKTLNDQLQKELEDKHTEIVQAKQELDDLVKQKTNI